MNLEIKQYTNSDIDKQDALDIFRNMKLDYDKARLQLIDYQLENLIADYEKLKGLWENIQQKFFFSNWNNMWLWFRLDINTNEW